jgi:membrane fusion protein, multidrug efflux system
VLGLCILALMGCLIAYWQYTQVHIRTDNAYINADSLPIAPQITGSVLSVPVQNYQSVKAGDSLLLIDPTPFTLALTQAEATVEENQAQLQYWETEFSRIAKLVIQGYLPPEAQDAATQSLDIAKAKLKVAKAQHEQAKLHLSYTHITAPINGIIQNLNVCKGAVVAATIPLFVLIRNDHYWADTNFKESELQMIRPAQKATLVLDMYPDHVFEGVVDRISASSGTAFSLLPPQNASGNWVKVTQRIPVKVRILHPDPRYPLRIGSTATVTVHTQ